MTGSQHDRLGISGARIAACRDQGRAALVGYLPVGYPDVSTSIAAMRRLTGGGERAGVDLVEIGMPYSDPVMDGVTIQHATTRALARGVRTRDLFSAVEAVAATGAVPMVMIYWNLVEQYGVDRFCTSLAGAGGAGLITPDLTPDEADDWLAASDAHGLDRVFLVSPSSTDARLASTVDLCRGWVYATSVMGVTGAREQSSTAGPELIARIRAHDPEFLVGLGLGVSNGRQVREIASYADAVIVGSALVRRLIEAEDAGEPADLARLGELVDDLAEGARPLAPQSGR